MSILSYLTSETNLKILKFFITSINQIIFKKYSKCIQNLKSSKPLETFAVENNLAIKFYF